MENFKGKKAIKVVLPLDIFDDSEKKQLEKSLTPDDKLQLLSKYFQLNNSHAASLKFAKNENTLSLFWQIPKISPEGERLHKQAIAAAKAGNLPEATKYWEQASSIDPYNPEYLFHLGVAYYESKKFKDAIQSLERALTICPILQRAYIILGMSYLKIRKFQEAKNYLETSLRVNQSNLLIYLNLGSIYGILKNYDKAEEMFMKAIKISSKEPRSYFGLAKIYATLGKNTEANNFFKKVIELDKKGTLANYAKRSMVIEREETAEPAAKISMPADSDENPEEYYTRGYRFFLMGNFAQAIGMYQNYLRIKPADDYVWYALGEAQLRSGDAKAAVESFKRAAKLSPQKGLYYKEMGLGFYYLEDWEKLAAAAKKAKELGKNDSLVYCLLGKALAELGNINESIVMLDHSLKRNGNNLLAKFFIAQSLLKKNEPENAIGYLDEIVSSKIGLSLKKRAQVLMGKIEAM